jgi:hypothetical protein
MDVNLDEKRKQAAELRMAGVGYQQIAQQLGFESVSGAYDATQAGLRAAFEEPTSEIRRLEVDRLDAMLTGLWAKARRGDVTAVDRVLKLMERRARYLNLDSDGSPQAGEKGDPVDDLASRRAARRSGTPGL